MHDRVVVVVEVVAVVVVDVPVMVVDETVVVVVVPVTVVVVPVVVVRVALGFALQFRERWYLPTSVSPTRNAMMSFSAAP